MEVEIPLSLNGLQYMEIYRNTDMSIYIHTNTQIYASICIYSHIIYLCMLRGPINNNIPAAMNLSSTQISVSKYHSLQKGSRVPQETWSVLRLA